jgi:uncharacterized membrane protein
MPLQSASSTKAGGNASIGAIAGLFVVAGTLHFVIPDMYASTVPAWVPNARSAVWWSGVAEIAGGLGVLFPATRRLAGWGLLALLVAVFPANVQMLVEAMQRDAGVLAVALLALRLPLQPLLMWWVWRSVLRRRYS